MGERNMITYTYDDMRHEIMSHLKVRPAGYGTWKVSTYVLDGAGNKIYDWFITHDEDDYRGTEGEDPQEWRERMADRFLDDEWYHNGCPDGIEYEGDWDDISNGEYLVGTEEDLEESHTRRGRMLKEEKKDLAYFLDGITKLEQTLGDNKEIAEFLSDLYDFVNVNCEQE